MEPVLKAMVDSVVRTFPLPRYQVLSPAEWVQTQVAEHLPRSVYDIIYN
jgi:3-hydroxybutyrate dehydrogenase